MITLSQLFYGLFTRREPAVTSVQTTLEPVHDEDATQGCEFLDDFSRLEEEPDDDIK